MSITIIVFFRYMDDADEFVEWKYDNMPKGWRFVERRCSGQPTTKYSHAAFFQGPDALIDAAFEYIEEYFANLYELEFVRRYKIKELGRHGS